MRYQRAARCFGACVCENFYQRHTRVGECAGRGDADFLCDGNGNHQSKCELAGEWSGRRERQHRNDHRWRNLYCAGKPAKFEQHEH